MEDVKTLRISLGVKQIKIAELLGINQANYNNIENGRLVPKNISEIRRESLKKLMPYVLAKELEIMDELSKIKKSKSFILRETHP